LPPCSASRSVGILAIYLPFLLHFDAAQLTLPTHKATLPFSSAFRRRPACVTYPRRRHCFFFIFRFCFAYVTFPRRILLFFRRHYALCFSVKCFKAPVFMVYFSPRIRMPLIRCRYVLCLFSYVYLGTGFRPYISIPLNCAPRQLQFCLLGCSAFAGTTAGCIARAASAAPTRRRTLRGGASNQINGNKIYNIILLPSLRASIPTRSWAYTEAHCKHQTLRQCHFYSAFNLFYDKMVTKS